MFCFIIKLPKYSVTCPYLLIMPGRDYQVIVLYACMQFFADAAGIGGRSQSFAPTICSVSVMNLCLCLSVSNCAVLQHTSSYWTALVRHQSDELDFVGQEGPGARSISSYAKGRKHTSPVDIYGILHSCLMKLLMLQLLRDYTLTQIASSCTNSSEPRTLNASL